MSDTESESTYHHLGIEASSSDTDIWLGDDNGHFVQKAVGILDTELLDGEYVVEFVLGTTTYPIILDKPRHLTEAQITSGPTCPRPEVKFIAE